MKRYDEFVRHLSILRQARKQGLREQNGDPISHEG